MGVCESLPEGGREEVERNRLISKQLRKEGTENVYTHKLLLLGAGESGKSTIFKQLRIVHKEGFGAEERRHYAFVVHNNVLEGLQCLCDCVSDHVRKTGLFPTSAANRQRGGSRLVEQLLLDAFSQFNSGDFDKAVHTFTTALSAESDHSEPSRHTHILYAGRAAAHCSLQQFNTALKDATAAVQIKPDYAKGEMYRGVALLGLKRYQPATIALEKAHELDAGNGVVRDYLARAKDLLEASKKLPEGWRQFEDDKGQAYFHNDQTGESTWKRPHVALPAIDVSPSPRFDSPLLEGSGSVSSEAYLDNPGADLEPVTSVQRQVREWQAVLQAAAEARAQSEEQNQTPFISPQLGQRMQKMWEHQAFRHTFADRAQLRLHVLDSLSYFMGDVKRIANSGYQPNNQDIVMTRVRTTGISEMRFSYGIAEFTVIDVGGQRSERRKWLHLFQDVQACIFVAAMNEYDQFLLEDSRRNRLIESLDLFEQICNNHWLSRTPMILFLNKRDLYAEKIQRVDLSVLFPEYKDGKDFDRGCRFLMQKFVDRNREDKDIFIHVTCATDTTNVKFVFEAVKDIILQKNVKAAGF